MSSRIPLSRILVVVVVMAVVAGVGGILALNRHTETAGTPRPQMAASHETEKARGKYVALGSSFASAPASNKRGRSNCGRSDDNYPNRVAQALGMRLDDRSCAGSTTSEILGPSKRYRQPAQIDAVTPDTELVTITSGGNDVGYVGRVSVTSCGNLAAYGMVNLRCNPNRLPSPVPTPADFVQVERNLEKIAKQIKKRAPGARVVFVDYPPIVGNPEAGCEKLPLMPWQIVDTQVIAGSLAAVTRQAATATGATLVTVSEKGASHTVCSAQPWLGGFPGHPPYHPTEAGKKGVADLVIDALR